MKFAEDTDDLKICLKQLDRLYAVIAGSTCRLERRAGMSEETAKQAIASAVGRPVQRIIIASASEPPSANPAFDRNDAVHIGQGLILGHQLWYALNERHAHAYADVWKRPRCPSVRDFESLLKKTAFGQPLQRVVRTALTHRAWRAQSACLSDNLWDIAKYAWAFSMTKATAKRAAGILKLADFCATQGWPWCEKGNEPGAWVVLCA